jgi:1-acyl-sn-glycerol-3-phosphate acyltransferase
MKYRSVYYYKDPLNDDFAGNGIKVKPLPKKFKWYHRGWIYGFISNLLYYVVAVPILWVYSKIAFSFKIVGKKKLRKAHLKGYFLYGNHTLEADGFLATIGLNLPRRTYVVANQAATSIWGLRWFIMMMGCLPVPDGPDQAAKFIDAIEKHYKHHGVIMIFPEAHIWPYCTRIRPFVENSFTYPAQLNAPVVAMCTTFEQRRFFKRLPPKVVIHVSDPFYPDMSKTLGERAKELRDQAYNYMEDVSASLDNYEFIHYYRLKDGSDAPKK